MTQLAIGPNTRITMHFALKLEDGSVVDSTFDKQAPRFVFGDGSLLQGFEKKLIGLQTGAKESFSILPEDGFGQHNPSNIQTFNRTDFSDDIELAEGLIVSFADAKGELPGVVSELKGEHVVVDFNHPLAGKSLTFEVEVLRIEAEATE